MPRVAAMADEKEPIPPGVEIDASSSTQSDSGGQGYVLVRDLFGYPLFTNGEGAGPFS